MTNEQVYQLAFAAFSAALKHAENGELDQFLDETARLNDIVRNEREKRAMEEASTNKEAVCC